jgi:hypothetical protein
MKRSTRPQTTVPKAKPGRRLPTPPPPKVKRAASPSHVTHPPPARRPPQPGPPKRQVAHIIDEGEQSLVDVLDSLLNQGVVLNAELILALANVDLVYLRLSALLCAADRVLPRRA